MYVTYFSLFSYILSPNLLYLLLYKYTVILKVHVLNFILLPTSLYSAGVLPQFLFFYQYIHIFCSICLYFYIFCIFYVPKCLPTSFLFIHTPKPGHYFPVSAYSCLQIAFLYHPPHYAAPFFLHLSMYTDLVHLFPNCCKESATFPFRLFAIFCIFCEPGSSVGIATDYGLDIPGIESWWGEIFHLSRPALRPTQPPVQ